MSLSGSIARNTIVQTIGKIVSVALGWVIVVMMTRSLGAEGFGAYTIMTAYLQFFGVAVDFGFVLVSSQLLAERPDDQPRIFANLLGFRLATSAVVLAIAPLAIWAFPYSLLVKQGVVVLTLSFFLAALMQVFTGFFQKELKVGRVLLGEIGSRVVLLAFIAWALSTGGGIFTMLLGVVAGALVNFLVLSISAGRFFPIRVAYDKELWQLMWRRSWPLMATIVLNLIYLKADTVILSLTRSQAEVGVYGAMYRVFEVLVTFPTMFASLLLPVLAGFWVRQDREQFRSTALRGVEAVVFAAVPMVIGVAFIAPHVVTMFGQEFLNDGPTLLRWLVLANAFVFIGTYFAHLVVAVDKQKNMIMPFAITAAIGLVGYLIFIPRYGALGAAVMTAVSEAVIALLAWLVAERSAGMKLPVLRPVVLALLTSLPMALWLWITLASSVWLTVPVAVALYAGVLYMSGNLPISIFGFLPLRSVGDKSKTE